MPTVRPLRQLRPADAGRHVAAVRPWQRRRLPSKIRLDGPAGATQLARLERAEPARPYAPA